jgi:hypothetical protein
LPLDGKIVVREIGEDDAEATAPRAPGSAPN